MNRLPGEIRQLGYVVNDIEASMEYWHRELGVGPWYYNPRVPIVDYRYRGQSYEVHNSVALANSGPMQVELIQTRNDVPSLYRDFMQNGQTGLQHIAYWTDRYDEDLAHLQQMGFEVVMSGEVGERGRFCYFEMSTHAGAHPGSVIELSEVAGPKGRMFDLIRMSSRGWDGSDPVRPFPDLSKV